MPVYDPISWAYSSSVVSAVSFHVWPLTVKRACAARYCFPALVKLFSAVVSSLAFISAGWPVVIGSTGCHCAIE